MPTQPHLPLQDYCKQLTELFQQAISQPDPALFLYKENARTSLFMAESLVRVLEEAEHKKTMEKALKLFKKLEDALGKIEENDALIKQFSKNKAIKKEELNYFIKKRVKAIEKLNDKLIKNEFYQDDFNKISDRLSINFNSKALVQRLQKQIVEELNRCFLFYSGCTDGFTDMDEQVHEIRRKLRWLSIYARSFKGVIMLEKENKKYDWEKKFNPASAAKSGYNKVIINKHLSAHIKFNQKAFYALNFVIESLGDIKDKGFQVESLARSIRKNSEGSKHDSEITAMEQLKLNYTMQDLLGKADILLKDYFETYPIHALLV